MGKVDSERKTGEEEARFIEHAKEEILTGLRKAQVSLLLPAGVKQERAVEIAACLVSEAMGYAACKEIIVGCNSYGFAIFDVRANKTPVKHQIGISNSLHLSPTRQGDLEKDGVTFRSISESAKLENFGATFICRFSRTGANYIEPFGFAQGKLLPLLDSIIENWKIGTFEQIMLIKNGEDYSQNYVF